MKSYQTTWSMLHKIRSAMKGRDDGYQLKDYIELDGASFGHKKTRNHQEVLVAIETKGWVDERGKPKSKAGFAKIIVARETKKDAQAFVDKAIRKDSHINSDASPSFTSLKNVDVDYHVTWYGKPVLDHWLPWVHRFVSNAKRWIIGTHHGVGAEYLEYYLAEYTWRFNRRHDPNSLFHRALKACALSDPKPIASLQHN